jgi:Heterokaryon incompatibility protein Het-C
LTLRELGFGDVFPHVGLATEMNLRGRQAYPLVTGTFGAVDFLHSVLGEANDHFTQTEVDELDLALKNAESGASSQRGMQNFVGLVSQIPGFGGGLADQARALQAESQAQEQENEKLRVRVNQSPQASLQSSRIAGLSQNIDPVKVAAQIYPIRMSLPKPKTKNLDANLFHS